MRSFVLNFSFCYRFSHVRDILLLGAIGSLCIYILIQQMQSNTFAFYKLTSKIHHSQKNIFTEEVHFNKAYIKDEKNTMCTIFEISHYENGSINFHKFNNQTGTSTGCCVVPNIVHLIKFNQEQFNFIEVICIASILENHRPDHLIIHTNVFQFVGKYWECIRKLRHFERIVIQYLSQPESIFNHSLKNLFGNWHSSDVARLEILKKYGGIYLDSDVYVVQNLNKYRVFEFAVEWNDYMNLGNQVLIGNKNARVLTPWLETYKQYNGSLWYYNGGELPTSAVLCKRPELIHRVKNHFGTTTAMIRDLYLQPDQEKKWKMFDAIHLFIRHQNYTFNESSVLKYKNFAIKEMILQVMPRFMYSN